MREKELQFKIKKIQNKNLQEGIKDLQKLLKSKKPIGIMPCLVMEENDEIDVELTLDLFYELLEHHGMFPRFARRDKIRMEFPLIASRRSCEKFFEEFNSFSQRQRQNHVYGICVISFCSCDSEIPLEDVAKLLDFVKNKRNTCAFMFSDVPEHLWKQLEERGGDFLFVANAEKVEEHRIGFRI